MMDILTSLCLKQTLVRRNKRQYQYVAVKKPSPSSVIEEGTQTNNVFLGHLIAPHPARYSYLPPLTIDCSRCSLCHYTWDKLSTLSQVWTYFAKILLTYNHAHAQTLSLSPTHWWLITLLACTQNKPTNYLHNAWLLNPPTPKVLHQCCRSTQLLQRAQRRGAILTHAHAQSTYSAIPWVVLSPFQYVSSGRSHHYFSVF